MRTRILVSIAVFVALLAPSFAATTAKKKPSKACAANLKACGDEGCGKQFDPKLNKRKNIRPDDPEAQGAAELHDVTWMRKLEEPANFVAGSARDDLAKMG
ncbi:MAG TPA: hypothetical protein VGJ82_21095, partial [Thermoanaerobaculia bacterium]